jgi:hypothetical protein
MSIIQSIINRGCLLAALAGITLFGHGCLTGALWEDTSSWREPALNAVGSCFLNAPPTA